MYTFDNYSFICAHQNKVVQISIVDYSVMFVGKERGLRIVGDNCSVWKGLFLIESGECISVIKVNVDLGKIN